MIQQQKIWGHRLAHWLATGFGVGYAPVAPGTFGTLLGIPLYLLIAPLATIWYGAIVVALFIVGIRICHIAETQFGRHDHRAIVWDEIVGYLITMFSAPSGWMWLIVGFALFRLFDIWKPFPIRRLERIARGGVGCMADDALAGVYAFVMLQIISQLVVMPIA